MALIDIWWFKTKVNLSATADTLNFNQNTGLEWHCL